MSDEKSYTDVQLYDTERNEYRYFSDDSLIPDGFDCLEKAKQYHKSLNRPIIPVDKVDISESDDWDDEDVYAWEGQTDYYETDKDGIGLVPKEWIKKNRDENAG